MPSRLFDNLNITNVAVINTTSASGYAEPSGVSANSSFSGFSFNLDGGATGQSAAATIAAAAYGGIYQISGDLDFSTFPAIPINAIITKVELSFSASWALIGSTSGYINMVANGGAGVDIPVTPGGTSGVATYATTKNSTFGPFNYDTLISLFQHLVLTTNFNINSSIGPAEPPLGPVNVSGNVSLVGILVNVTYNTGPFSWYLTTHQDTVDGNPVTIVDSAVEVPDGDTPPVGSTLYGTSEDFPDGPVYYDWYYLPTGVIYNQPISPNTSFPWYILLVDEVDGITFSMDFVSTVVLLVDPSGIYTLIPNQTHDKLISRPGGTATVVDIEIPDPTIQLGLI